MFRALFDPDTIMKRGGQNRVWQSSEEPIGVESSVRSWVTGASDREGSSRLGNADPPTDAEAPNNPDLTYWPGRAQPSAESPDIEHTPGPSKLVLQPVSGESFMARILARARWPESSNVEDRRNAPDPRSRYTIDEWLEKAERLPKTGPR